MLSALQPWFAGRQRYAAGAQHGPWLCLLELLACLQKSEGAHLIKCGVCVCVASPRQSNCQGLCSLALLCGTLNASAMPAVPASSPFLILADSPGLGCPLHTIASMLQRPLLQHSSMLALMPDLASPPDP